MLVLLVRHGHAGAKRTWSGDDSFRPLNGQGLAESEALVDLLLPFVPTRIVSSPFVRCLQSVDPLAQAAAIFVERSPSLVPEAGAAATLLALGITTEGTGSVVLCTHGEIIHDMQTRLASAALSVFGPGSAREKGSVWVLDRADGHFVDATYLPPPRVTPL